MKILSIHQFASKKASGSEDCLIDMVDDLNEMINDAFPPQYESVDSSDAFNAMDPDIIDDKMRYHCGFDDTAMVMFGSLTYGVKSVCKTQSRISLFLKNRISK
eukprot:13481_1